MNRSLVLLSAALLASASLAGCLGGDKPPEKDEPVKKSTKGGTTPSPTTPTPKDQDELNQTLGKRYHFHNYWGTSPNLTLYDAELELGPQNATLSVVPQRATVGAVAFRLPYGTIVPPETGTVTVSLHYNATPLTPALAVEYKPAGAAAFIPAGNVPSGGSVKITVTKEMADVPHRGRSLWEFRFSAAANEHGVGAAVDAVHAVIVATIGRPIFVDAPHVDHWRGRDTIAIVGADAEVNALKLPAQEAPYTVLTPAGAAESRQSVVDFPVLNGSVVPEGAKVVLARLTWTSTTPAEQFLPSLEFLEENSGSFGAATLVGDNPGERLYRIPVAPRQTDPPYANQSSWRLRVVLEGDAAAFAGSLRLDAWASQLPEAEAVFPDGPADPQSHLAPSADASRPALTEPLPTPSLDTYPPTD